MIDLHALLKRIRYCVPTRTLIPALVPMFLIISSSVYPAILSGIENKEFQIVPKVMSQLEKKTNAGTSNYHSNLPTPGSQDLVPSSPTPIDPTSPASFSSTESNKTQVIHIQDENVDGMTATTINAGDLMHVLWQDDTPGNNDIFHRRVGADFDPITVNLSNNAGFSFGPAIAVSGNNVYLVWADLTGGGKFGDPVHKIY